MSALAEPIEHAAFDDRLARRNAMVLAVAQALAGGNNTVIVATASIIGAMLAPDKGLATLPITVMVFGMWFGTLADRHAGAPVRPAFRAAERLGLRRALRADLLQRGDAGQLLAACSSARFAAGSTPPRTCPTASPPPIPRAKPIARRSFPGCWPAAFLPRVIGPQLVILTKDLLAPHLFAASYLGQSACALLAGVRAAVCKIAAAGSRKAVVETRPLGEIVLTPRFIVAAACGVASYAMMNMVMTSAPLAMVGCGHSVTDATLGIQWHVLAMYAPSFITGALIVALRRRSASPRSGWRLIAVAAVVGMSGITVAHFWTALVLLGVGWNFAFIGATTMVTQCHRPDERNKVQAFNDFLIFGSMAVSSFSSGQLLDKFGWAAVNEVVFPTVIVAGRHAGLARCALSGDSPA